MFQLLNGNYDIIKIISKNKNKYCLMISLNPKLAVKFIEKYTMYKHTKAAIGFSCFYD